MSQYPPVYPSGPVPYQTPGPLYDPLADLLGPAKRAGVLMIVFGSIAIACGLCFGLVGLAWEEVLRSAKPADAANIVRLESQFGVPLKVMMLVLAGGSLLAGLVFLILGVVVRRGGPVGVYASMVLAVLISAYLAFNAIGLMALGDKSQMAGGLCFTVFGLGSMVLLMIWLVSAARNIRRIRELKEYQRNYYLYVQQQQAAAYQQNPYAQPGAWPGYPQQQPPQQQPPQYPNWPPQPPQA